MARPEQQRGANASPSVANMLMKARGGKNQALLNVITHHCEVPHFTTGPGLAFVVEVKFAARISEEVGQEILPGLGRISINR